MTTETAPTKTIEQELKEVETNLAAAQKNQADAQKAFTDLMANGGQGKTIEEQLAISQAALEAGKRVEGLQSTLVNTQKRVKLAALEAPVNTFRDGVRKLFTDAKLADLMKSVDAGSSMTVNIAVSPETGDVAVSTRFANAVSAPRSAGSSNGSGAHGRVAIEADGKGYGATEYLQAYLKAAIDEGKVKWGTFDERMAFTKDHAVRARNLAKVLGHKIVEGEAAPAPASA